MDAMNNLLHNCLAWLGHWYWFIYSVSSSAGWQVDNLSNSKSAELHLWILLVSCYRFAAGFGAVYWHGSWATTLLVRQGNVYHLTTEGNVHCSCWLCFEILVLLQVRSISCGYLGLHGLVWVWNRFWWFGLMQVVWKWLMFWMCCRFCSWPYKLAPVTAWYSLCIWLMIIASGYVCGLSMLAMSYVGTSC